MIKGYVPFLGDSCLEEGFWATAIHNQNFSCCNLWLLPFAFLCGPLQRIWFLIYNPPLVDLVEDCNLTFPTKSLCTPGYTDLIPSASPVCCFALATSIFQWPFNRLSILLMFLLSQKWTHYYRHANQKLISISLNLLALPNAAHYSDRLYNLILNTQDFNSCFDSMFY